MKPLKLEFQAFGPYAGRQEIDFEKLSSKGLFLICGQTGSGKTMILDAMTYALYGMSSGNVRDDFESMRCTAADADVTTYVKFTFESAGNEYIFERRLERKRKNLSKSYNMMKKDEDGVFRVMLENAKEKDLTKKATELIGLEYDQFRQVIVLPQGQFEKLLTSGSDEKEKILINIFGEDKWQLIAENIYEEANAKREALKAKKENIANSLREEGCESLEQLSELITEKMNQLSELKAQYEKSDYPGIIKRMNESLMLVKRFDELDKAKALVQALADELPDRDNNERILNDLKRAEKVRQFILDVSNLEKNAGERKIAYENAVEELDKLEQKVNKAKEEVSLHAKSESAIEEKKKDKVRYESKREDYGSLEEVKEEVSKKEISCKSAERIMAEAEGKLSAAHEKVTSLNEEYETLTKEHLNLNSAYIAGITGFLAKDLSEGSKCPVCGSTHHPEKATLSETSVSKEAVKEMEEKAREKGEELSSAVKISEDLATDFDRKKTDYEKKKSELLVAEKGLEAKLENLYEDIPNLDALNERIEKLDREINSYDETKALLDAKLKQLSDEYTEAKTKCKTAKSEELKALEEVGKAKAVLAKQLDENGFANESEARELLTRANEIEKLQNEIANYDASVKSANNRLLELTDELKEIERPNEEYCLNKKSEAEDATSLYTTSSTRIETQTERLKGKYENLLQMGEDIENVIKQVEDDWVFAKRLRGDTGTSLQRYVLGIMFSSVIVAANKMLELVHDGRYQLYRSDEKSSGARKQGLELKVIDKYSDDPDGRFVNTLSGGEKFLASLALSIGMSTVAQRGGMKIEALFIDEGFGSLDENSIADAMNVLSSIQKANGLVGIISHVQLLRERIPSKLEISKKDGISNIVETIG